MVLMTSHNNRRQCIDSIGRLADASKLAGLETTVFLANSGLSIFQEDFEPPDLEVIELPTSEDTYWAKGMRLAWESATTSDSRFDYVLWLNDDTLVHPSSISHLRRTLTDTSLESVVIGSCVDENGIPSYGGLVKDSWIKPLHFKLVEPPAEFSLCDTFNGNLVFMKHETAVKLGGFPHFYTHLRADIDFGLTANRNRISTIVAPGVLALCQKNEGYLGYADLKGLKLLDRIRAIDTPKFGPYREHIYFSLKFGGLVGPLYSIAPLLRSIVSR